MNVSDLYYIRHSFRRQANAGVKPSTDVEDVLKDMGSHPIGLPRAYFSNDKIVHLRDIVNTMVVRAAMPYNKAILLQYPGQYEIVQLARLAKKRHNRLIIFIHDINALRGRPEADCPEALELADVIIAHTPAMKQWLEQRYPKAKIIVLGMFDYNQPKLPCGQAPMKHSVVFAGNLTKSKFLNYLNFPDSLRLVLYGLGIPEEVRQKQFVEYRGSCMPEEIPERICNETFGLVWDGDSSDSCSGPMGQYLNYNAPYKLSSYIAAGIPVIIWSKMGIAPFVETQGIGIAVESLKDLPARLSAITPQQYEAMRVAVRALQQQISNGDRARIAISKALEFY